MTDRSRSARRSPRYWVRLRVVMNGGRSFACNVGPGGFCTHMMRVLPAGAQVQGMIFFEGRDRMFKGRVAWVTPGDFRMGRMGRMGISFLEIDPDLVEVLASHEASTASNDGRGDPAA